MDSESSPLLEEHPHARVHPTTVVRITARVEALVMELLPIQVDQEELTSPTSSILTPQVVDAFSLLAGDFSEVLPFALLEARRYFHRASHLNPSDGDENRCRKIACEALARKLVARVSHQDQYALLSTRYTMIDSDGEETLPWSAIESAVDQHATFFLSSNESQRCVFALWRGLLVQQVTQDGGIIYKPYARARTAGGLFDSYDPSRIGVPRYQFFFRIVLWVIFIMAYSVAIQTPDRGFSIEDVVLYIQLLGYILEDLTTIYKIGLYHALGFWTVINFLIYTLLSVAFAYRVADLVTTDKHRSDELRMLSFQFLASASPLIWMKLLTIFDLFQYFGMLQIVVRRMLKEAGVFFVLLALLAVGFAQALTGLDVATERRQSVELVVNSLAQGLLGSPAFDLYARGSASYPFGMILYYLWSIMVLIILLNILIALFGSAYAQCTDEAGPTFLAFFAEKTIAAIRAPDTYVFVAPFNLIEIFILPLEYILDPRTYANLNRYIMGILFFPPLCIIAIFETYFDTTRHSAFLSLSQDIDEFGPGAQNPEPQRSDDEFGPGEEEEKVISRVSFEDLKNQMPSLLRSTDGQILWEIQQLRQELHEMRREKNL